MMEVLWSAAAFVVALGVLVTVHEFGHYWVARRAGVKILRFSVGFGRPLVLRRLGADGTEFALAAVPLGGYVKMLDEREGAVAEAELARAFNRQSLGRRTAIVAAGPVANLLFAVLAYWLMFMVGVTGLRPLIGEVQADSIAARAGLEPGMEVLAIDGTATPTWEAVLHASVGRVLAGRELLMKVRDGHGGEAELTLDLRSLEVDDITRGEFFQRLGARPYRVTVPAVLGELSTGGAAERDGFRAGDRILAVDGAPVADWDAWVDLVRASPERVLSVDVARAGERLTLTLTPTLEQDRDGPVGRIGAAPELSLVEQQPDLAAVERYGPAQALWRALQKTWDMCRMTLTVLVKMLFGQASVENLSGPLSIAHFAGQSASIGLDAFLGFLAVVSVSLGILNLLPIPLLDGGHLLFYFVEFLRRRPVPEAVQAYGQQVGLFILLCLMGTAVVNDVSRFVPSAWPF